MHTLSKAKSAIELDETMTNQIADFVADNVTSNVYKSLDKLSNAAAGATGSLALLEAEIESLKSATSRVSSEKGNSVGGLVAKRDHLKVLAQKKCDLLNIKIRSVPEENRAASGSNSLSKDELMSQAFGDKWEDIVASKAKCEELEKDRAKSDSSSTERQGIVSDIEAWSVRKNNVSEKIKELEMEISLLTSEQDDIDKEIT